MNLLISAPSPTQHSERCIFAGPVSSAERPYLLYSCHVNLLRQSSGINPFTQRSLTALFISSSYTSSGIYFPALYLAICTSCFDCFLFFMYGSGWPTRSARLEAPHSWLTCLCTEYSVCIRSSTNICRWECQFCKHLETILKGLFATTGICLELISYLKVMFSEPLSYRNVVKWSRMKHNPLCSKFKGLLLEEVSS